MSKSKKKNKKYIEGKKKMFEILKIFHQLSDAERMLYITKEIEEDKIRKFTFDRCICFYSQDTIEKAVSRYLMDHLLIGDIIIRKKDKLEYLVVDHIQQQAGTTYKCVCLTGDKDFILKSFDEYKKTDKHINIVDVY